MTLRGHNRVRGLLQLLALLSATAVVLAVAETIVHSRLASSHEREEFVRVTGFALPAGASEDTFQILTDRGAFEWDAIPVAEGVRQDPWFHLRIGENYRVRVKGRECETLLGVFHPKIIDAHRVPMTAAQGSL